jgi:hypothetical protein
MSGDRSLTPPVAGLAVTEKAESGPPQSETIRHREARALKGGVYLTGPGFDHELFSDTVLIGRSPSCQVVVDDPLVSREHAMIRIRADRVLIEDLRSRNGVYLNNVRIFGARELFDGDRLLVGTTELCASFAEAHEREAPSVRSIPDSRSGWPDLEAVVSTQPTGALELLGRLADRMLEENDVGQAERVLERHLQALLDGARAELPVPADTCAEASRRALMLAQALWSGRWVDYAVELHLRAELAMSLEILDQLEDAVDLSFEVDHVLLARYIEWLRDALERLPPGAQEVVERLDGIMRFTATRAGS